MGSVAQAVMDRNDEKRSALLAGDADRLRGTMAEDLVFIHTTGKVETRDEYIARLTSGVLRYDAISESNTRMRVIGDVAVLVQDVSQQVSLAGQERTLHSVATSVWSRESGDWQMRTYQVTTRVPEAVPVPPLKWP